MSFFIGMLIGTVLGWAFLTLRITKVSEPYLENDNAPEEVVNLCDDIILAITVSRSLRQWLYNRCRNNR